MTIGDHTVEKIKDELDLIVASCSSSPFLMSLLQKAQVYASELVPTAGVDKTGSLYVNPEFWRKQDKKTKVYIIIHEVLHLAFRHPWRFDGVKYKLASNIAEDSVVNETISDHGRKTPDKAVKADHIARMVGEPVEDIKTMSAEEVYELVREEAEKQRKQIKKKLRRDVFGDRRNKKGMPSIPGRKGKKKKGKKKKGKKKKGKGTGDKEEGDEKVVRKGVGGEDEEEAEEKWRQNLARAAVAAKQAGELPGNVERLVEKLLEPKVPWRSLLRQAIRDGLNGDAMATWKRPNRRFPNTLPGIKRKTRDIYVLVDTSGSIGQQELQQYLSEIYTLTDIGDVTVFPWDARAYEPLDVSNSKAAVKQMDIKGGGGTIIRPVLEKMLRKKPTTVVILSDGVIGDLDDSKTRQLLTKLASKSTEAVFLTTHSKPKINGWRTIKIEEQR